MVRYPMLIWHTFHGVQHVLHTMVFFWVLCLLYLQYQILIHYKNVKTARKRFSKMCSWWLICILRSHTKCRCVEESSRNSGLSWWLLCSMMTYHFAATGLLSLEGSSVNQQNPGVNYCNIAFIHWRRFAPVVPNLMTHNRSLWCHPAVTM